MTSSLDPLVSRRKLRTELRQIRVGLERKQAEVAERLYWSASKLGRIESGEVTISITDLRALLAEYGVTDAARVQDLIALANAARRAHRQRSPWEDFRGVASDEFLTYLAFEARATAIRSFQPTVVPGLLQVEPYMRTVIESSLASRDEDRVDRLVDMRRRRQELVFDEGAGVRERYFIVDESALHRVVGGPAVMRQQLSRLLELIESERPDRWFRVVPFDLGLYPSWQTPYVIIELSSAGARLETGDEPDSGSPDGADADQHVLFLENERGSLIIQEQEKGGHEALAYLRQFLALADRVDRATSVALIERALKELPEP